MRRIAVALAMFLATGAQAIEVCPDGEFVTFTGTSITVSGNTCGEQFTGEGVSNGYTPRNYPASTAPDHGYITIMPAGSYRVRLTSSFPGAVVEVMDLAGGDCVHGPYGWVRSQKPLSPSGIYSGFDAPRTLGIFVDGQYFPTHCGPYTVTLTAE